MIRETDINITIKEVVRMMGNYYYGGTMMGGWGTLAGITWLLLVIFLLLGIAYYWKGLNRKK